MGVSYPDAFFNSGLHTACYRYVMKCLLYRANEALLCCTQDFLAFQISLAVAFTGDIAKTLGTILTYTIFKALAAAPLAVRHRIAVCSMAPKAKTNAAAVRPSAAAEQEQLQPARKRARATKKQQPKLSQKETPEGPETAVEAPKQPRKAPSKQPADDANAPKTKTKARARKAAPAAAAEVVNNDLEVTDRANGPQQSYYLVKSEPHVFSIDQLEQQPNQTEGWDGVRNAQARNIMKSMRVGELAFFYHSSCKVPGIMGIAKVVREAYPDASQFDSSSQYHDPSSSKDKPKWWQVDFQLVRKLNRQITLEELKTHKEGSLAGMALFNRPRLSVQPVTQEQWDFVMFLEDKDAEKGS